MRASSQEEITLAAQTYMHNVDPVENIIDEPVDPRRERTRSVMASRGLAKWRRSTNVPPLFSCYRLFCFQFSTHLQ